ncbi:MAG: AraC family transcriptional regulator ligand-binding domain-containing protein [Nevskiales bacterium]
MDYLNSLNIDPTSVFTPEDVAALAETDTESKESLNHWLGLVAQAVRTTADPDTALKIGAEFKIRYLGIAGYVLMSCQSLDEVGKQARRYIRLLGDVGVPQLVRRGKFSELHLEWRDGDCPPAMEQIFIGATASLGRWLTARSDLVFDAYFRCKRPEDTDEYRQLLGGNLAFGQLTTKLVFPTSYLELPIVSGNPHAMKIVEAHALTMMDEGAQSEDKEAEGMRQVDAEFLVSLNAVVKRNLPLGHVRLSEIAPQLSLSKRTLQRRLSDHGLTFHEVLEDARRSQAEQLLGNFSLSLAEIAFMLGYTEQSTFQQAFKRWTGTTPGGFRSRIKRDLD